MKNWNEPQFLTIDISDTQNSKINFAYPDGALNGTRPNEESVTSIPIATEAPDVVEVDRLS
uniref:hypothetical protein n=1 Tax=Eubacterium cellulosolvens TaxID=29322 RepID=UPI000482A93D|nr:hypothetical protein [[Eubacterium] cellulosolvens]